MLVKIHFQMPHKFICDSLDLASALRKGETASGKTFPYVEKISPSEHKSNLGLYEANGTWNWLCCAGSSASTNQPKGNPLWPTAIFALIRYSITQGYCFTFMISLPSRWRMISCWCGAPFRIDNSLFIPNNRAETSWKAGSQSTYKRRLLRFVCGVKANQPQYF